MNTEVVNEIRNALKTQINDKIVNPIPVIEVNPKIVKTPIAGYNTRTATGGVAVYTTPSSQDFYLTELTYGMVKDAANDMATGNVTVSVTIGGAVTNIVAVPIITLTAQQYLIQLIFSHPLKLDRGTSITITSQAYAAGTMVRSVAYVGFIDEASNA